MRTVVGVQTPGSHKTRSSRKIQTRFFFVFFLEVYVLRACLPALRRCCTAKNAQIFFRKKWKIKQKRKSCEFNPSSPWCPFIPKSLTALKFPPTPSSKYHEMTHLLCRDLNPSMSLRKLRGGKSRDNVSLFLGLHLQSGPQLQISVQSAHCFCVFRE